MGAKAVIEAIWAALERAMSGQGVTGQRVPVVISSSGSAQAVQQVPGLFVDVQNLEQPYSIPWLVTLVGWKYNGDSIVKAPTSALPSDNQVTTIANDPVKVTVSWGAAIGEDTQVDYPWSGSTFVVVGKRVRVELFNSAWDRLSVTPKLGAFVVPLMGHAGGGGVERAGPRYTTPIVSLLQGGDLHDFPIPRRATSYRTFSNIGLNDVGGDSGLAARAEQRTADAVPFTVQVDYDGTFGLADISTPASSSRWWPLHPAAEVVRVTNTRGVGQRQLVGVQFQMDLG